MKKKNQLCYINKNCFKKEKWEKAEVLSRVCREGDGDKDSKINFFLVKDYDGEIIELPATKVYLL